MNALLNQWPRQFVWWEAAKQQRTNVKIPSNSKNKLHLNISEANNKIVLSRFRWMCAICIPSCSLSPCISLALLPFRLVTHWNRAKVDALRLRHTSWAAAILLKQRTSFIRCFEALSTQNQPKRLNTHTHIHKLNDANRYTRCPNAYAESFICSQYPKNGRISVWEDYLPWANNK